MFSFSLPTRVPAQQSVSLGRAGAVVISGDFDQTWEAAKHHSPLLPLPGLLHPPSPVVGQERESWWGKKEENSWVENNLVGQKWKGK